MFFIILLNVGYSKRSKFDTLCQDSNELFVLSLVDLIVFRTFDIQIGYTGILRPKSPPPTSISIFLLIKSIISYFLVNVFQ
jgi:hypothetical protein